MNDFQELLHDALDRTKCWAVSSLARQPEGLLYMLLLKHILINGMAEKDSPGS